MIFASPALLGVRRSAPFLRERFVVDQVPEYDVLWRPQYSEPGVYRFDGEGWTFFTTDDGLSGLDLTSVVVGDDGSVWFGTYSHGVTRYEPGTDPQAGTTITIRGDALPEAEWPPAPVTTTAPAPSG